MYFSVAANNGYGVFTDEEKLKSAIIFLNHPIVNKFDSKCKAFEEAIDIYNGMQDDYDAAYFGQIDTLQLNWIIFRKEIVSQNKDNI